MQDPVIKVRKALYGHPDSPGLWERHLEAGLSKVGFEPIAENWPSVFYHKHLKLFLMVYVDDFKLAGPKDNLAQGWDLISSASGANIKLDAPSPMGLC